MKKSLTLVLASLMLAGCAGVTVQRAKDLSSAGVAYSQATGALVDAAVDAMINADSEGLLRSYEGPNAPKETPEVREAKLRNLDKLLIENTKSYLRLKASLGAVEAYFVGMQALADNPESEAAASAVSSLADRVNGLNKVLQDDPKARDRISNEQKQAFSGLAKLVFDQVHGARVAAALRRDAGTIALAFAFQAEMLELAEIDIGNNLRERANVFYVDKVQRPFKTGATDSSWVANRRTYVIGAATGQVSAALKTAQSASKQMTKAWEKVLSGTYDLAEMRKSIEEVRSLLATANALKAAPGPKAPGNASSNP